MKYILETEHLRLRSFQQSDAECLYEIHIDEEVKKWIPNESYEDVNESQEAIAFFAGRVARNVLPYVLAVELKETGELIGDTGINEVEGKPGEAEIGFVICRKYRGKGYASEAVEAMTEFAGSSFLVKSLYGRVLKGNQASVKVLEKNGYCFVTEEFGAEDDPYGKGMLVYTKSLMEHRIRPGGAADEKRDRGSITTG